MVLPKRYVAQDHQERAESQGGQAGWYCNNNSRGCVLQILEAVEELLADDTSLINNGSRDSAFPGTTSNFGFVLATDGGTNNSRVLLVLVQPVPPVPPSSIARSTVHESSSTRGRHDDQHVPQNPFLTRRRMIPVTTTRRNWSTKTRSDLQVLLP